MRKLIKGFKKNFQNRIPWSSSISYDFFQSFTDSLNDKSSSEHYAVMKSSDSGHWPLSPPLRISRQREICDDRPHTISSVYEHSHSRSALCPQTFQPLSCQGSSVPTTPNPHITSMRPSRIRPHSLVRNIELAELLDRRDALLRRQNETCMTSSVDSSTRGRMQNMQPYASIISAGGMWWILYLMSCLN